MRELFITDWGWKLFSLLLAVAIWLTVHRSYFPAAHAGASTLTYGNLPVVIVSASADVRDYRLRQPTVAVTVSGSPEVIGKLQANQIHATVALDDFNAVNNTSQRVEVSVPEEVTVVSVKPESISVIAPPGKR